jgi:D-beta-D-heptose 7-phosphate kinase / D-beta-D-heptose 1-phosphate adenosyltransferase
MKEIVEHLKNSDKKSVLIIGDVMLDEYLFGDVERISPEAPVPVIREERRDWSLGGATNVALNCKQIGCDVDIVGVVGASDQPSQKLLSMLEKNNIPTSGILKSSYRVTTSKQRIMAKNQQLFRIDLEDTKNLIEVERRAILENIDKTLKPNSIVIISDYAKGVIDSFLVEKIVQKSKEKNSTILVDPKGPDYGKYKNVDYVKPNLKEYKEMVNFFGLPRDASIVENGKKICSLLSLRGLIVTLGENGIEFVSASENIKVPPIKKSEVYDLTGAGDTVIAFLSLGLLSNLDMEKCLKLANHAASVAILHLKTYAVSLDELVDKDIEISEKFIPDLVRLKIELDWLRIEKKKVILTNGCFDLLHAGHIQILKEAKKRGEVLVVALNTDESIKRLKGSSRPIKNLEDRVRVMAAIGFVDFVTCFGEDTPLNLIKYLKPDILAKGGDYEATQVIGYDFITSYGGKVEIINHNFTEDKGYSTTNLEKQISAKVAENTN